MKLNFSYWIKFSLFNLLLVASLGLLMRYKIAFEFPFLNQKNIQHSHSHFAFAGWVSQTLIILMIHFLSKQNVTVNLEKYKKIFIANLVCAYVMLFSFIFQGYGLISILFSTLSLFVSFWFAAFFLKDLKIISKDNLSKNWFKAALFFNIISSFGTFALAYMMATKNITQDFYLSSIYFYLHFQYNGWFWFACMGLFVSQLIPNLTIEKTNKTVFKWFFISCIPAYLLSILWLKLPIWIYIIAVFCSLLQIGAWVKFLKSSISSFLKNYPVAPFFKWIYISIIVCVSIKFFLQLGSTVPLIGKLAFGFRPIVIAYLHLVLLAIISGFLLVYIFTNRLVIQNNTIKKALAVFIIGIFLNELVLAVQGVASFSYTLIPYINEMLFGIAILLFFGAFRMFYLNVNNG
ncbi:hypothetical protein FIA58_000310 [Flavobacterium jejuense]|uniref:NnrS protein n=1 Tax=Flavobacterium jejuense TaxID=1544455 RepID=A0ABX0IJV2_9FLAO|nr:hypothetical protein [Flavobacterium jejuense]NHN24104.1 hypothetical protein [Flavobacterium jejuense]